MKSIDQIIADIILAEGGDKYTNKPNDSGGPTKFGITLKALSDYRGRACTEQDVMDLQEPEARQIYLKKYYLFPCFDLVHSLSQAIAVELTDTGVNMGPKVATIFLQRVLNVFNNRGKLYPDMQSDGMIGQKTIDALRAYLQYRKQDGELVMLKALNDLQGAAYIELAERREKDEESVFGWIKQRA
jgi:lysozyme family protein